MKEVNRVVWSQAVSDDFVGQLVHVGAEDSHWFKRLFSHETEVFQDLNLAIQNA